MLTVLYVDNHDETECIVDALEFANDDMLIDRAETAEEAREMLKVGKYDVVAVGAYNPAMREEVDARAQLMLHERARGESAVLAVSTMNLDALKFMTGTRYGMLIHALHDISDPNAPSFVDSALQAQEIHLSQHQG